jgi:hypothetical protein
LTFLWVVFWSWQARFDGEDRSSRLRNTLKRLMFLGMAIFLGVCIAAVQLLPTAEYLLQSQRAAEVDFEAAMTYSFSPWRLFSFFTPDLFGSPVTGDFVGYATYWEDAVYIGLLPILLAFGVLVGAIFRRKQKSITSGEKVIAFNRRSLAIFLLVIIFFSFLFALGINTPIFPWLYQHVPMFDMFKSPTRFSIWAIFALSLLAGVGAERWRRPTGRGLYWMRLSVAAAFAVSLGAGLGWILLRDIPNMQISFVRAMASAGFWGMGAVILLLFAPEKQLPETRSVKRWQSVVVFWVLLDLLVAGRGLNPGTTLDFYTKTPANAADVRSLVAGGRSYLLAEDEYNLTYEQYFTFKTFNPGRDWNDLRGTFLPNLNVLDGISIVNNYDPMVPGRYARWMETIAEMDIQSRDDLLDLMAVTVIEKVDSTADFGVVFSPRESAPRANWVPCAQFVSGEQDAWDLLLSGNVNFRNLVILENGHHSSVQDCTALFGKADIVNERPNQIEIQTQAPSKGWLVLSDIWYPGWRAKVDGISIPIFRANYLFRAVEVPAGSHLVSFIYRPVWFLIGLVVSLLTYLGLLILAFVRRVRDG